MTRFNNFVAFDDGTVCRLDNTDVFEYIGGNTGSSARSNTGSSGSTSTLSISGLTPGSWNHWKVTITGASAQNHQSMTITLTRPDTTSDPMLFLRRGSKATLRFLSPR